MKSQKIDKKSCFRNRNNFFYQWKHFFGRLEHVSNNFSHENPDFGLLGGFFQFWDTVVRQETQFFTLENVRSFWKTWSLVPFCTLNVLYWTWVKISGTKYKVQYKYRYKYMYILRWRMRTWYFQVFQVKFVTFSQKPPCTPFRSSRLILSDHLQSGQWNNNRFFNSGDVFVVFYSVLTIVRCDHCFPFHCSRSSLRFFAKIYTIVLFSRRFLRHIETKLLNVIKTFVFVPEFSICTDRTSSWCWFWATMSCQGTVDADVSFHSTFDWNVSSDFHFEVCWIWVEFRRVHYVLESVD